MVLPSSRTGTNPARSSPPALSLSLAAWRVISHRLTVASKASASASVTTRQIVALDGGRAGLAPARMYRSASTGGGTSFTQPAIAVKSVKHTSDLQSLKQSESPLLLEKKKDQTTIQEDVHNRARSSIDWT